MIEKETLILNEGQQRAGDGFFEFLFTTAKELIISGPGGYGKTKLMGYLIDEVMPKYLKTCQLMGIEPEYDNVVMTATTNKAAEELARATGRPAGTIHQFLNLKVMDDYVTGRSRLTKTPNWTVHTRRIIFIDECSMIDGPLYTMLHEGTQGCKIVYVGDHSQLAPVMESISPIYKADLPFYELTQPMRNADSPALMAVCAQLRETVATGIFKPIQIVPGSIDWLDGNQMQHHLDHIFRIQTNSSRILAYTNRRVIEYNEYIRGMRDLPMEYSTGEILINNQSIRVVNYQLSVEEEVEIVKQDSRVNSIFVANYDGGVIHMDVRTTELKNKYGNLIRVQLPVDRNHFLELVKYFKQTKNWNRYFWLKNNFPELRPRDAATIHKAQGSTHDSVFIDLEDLSTCHIPDMVARLLYVGFTRPRQQVFLYGKLADKYGGLVW